MDKDFDKKLMDNIENWCDKSDNFKKVENKKEGAIEKKVYKHIDNDFKIFIDKPLEK